MIRPPPPQSWRVDSVTRKLVGEPEHVLEMKAADHGGATSLIIPRFVILHYTAGSSFGGATRTLTERDENYVSAHLVIGRDGTVAQLVPFDVIAYHAGESSWRGYRRLNSTSIGIELVNPGWVRPGFPAWPSIRAAHKHGGDVRDWYTYPDEQIDALNGVLRALYGAFGSLRETIGHDDVAPGRKSDPGPALDFERVAQPSSRGA